MQLSGTEGAIAPNCRLKRIRILAALWPILLTGCAQGAAGPVDTPQITLIAYVGDQIVGEETIRTLPSRSSVIESYTSKLAVGPGLDLKTELATTSHKPLWLRGSGRNLPWFAPAPDWDSTWSGASAAAFPLSSPFPVGQQAALIRYWRAQGRPRHVVTAAGKKVSVSECGMARRGGLVMNCYEVSGLVWGRSILWLDPSQRLKAAFVSTVLGNLEYLADEAAPERSRLLEVAARGGERIAAEARPLASAANDTLVLKNLNFVDVVGGTMISDAAIVVKGERIVAAGPAVSQSIPADARVIDLGGKTVLPGLWDMHAHYRNSSWGPAYLGTGITTVRDLGNTIDYIQEVRRSANSGASLSPRILLGGVIGNPRYPQSEADDVSAGVALVDRYKAAGFDEIKVWENVSGDVLSAVIRRAHELGLEVTGHIPAGLTLRQAIEAGQDQVNHTSPLLAALSSTDGFRSPRELAQYLAKAGTMVEPNLVALEFRLHRLNEKLVDLEPGAREAPADLVAAFQALRGSPDTAATATPQFQLALEVVKELHRAGVPIVAGSDQGIPGFSLLREIELYVLAGISNIDAIRAATIVPAQRMRLSAAVGSIAPNMRADLTIVEGDPLEDIRTLRQTCAVVLGGKLFDTTELRAAAGFAVAKREPCIGG